MDNQQNSFVGSRKIFFCVLNYPETEKDFKKFTKIPTLPFTMTEQLYNWSITG